MRSNGVWGQLGMSFSGWKEVKLEDIAKIKGRIGWKGYKTSDLREYGPIVLGGNNIKNSIYLDLSDVKHLSLDKYKESPEIMLKANDILVVTRGNGIGDVSFFDGSIIDATINPSMVIISNCTEYPKFLFYYMISSIGREHILSVSSGSSIPAIYQKSLATVKCTVPPLSEQKAIAHTLSCLDDKIELNNRINKTLEEIAQAIFKSWFIEFEPSQNENSDSLPSGWKFYVLGDVSEMSAGGDKPKIFSKIPTETCKIPVYSNGIDNYGLYGYAETARIMTESVTVSARGTIGFVCLREEPYVPIVRLVSIVPNAKFLSSKYLYLWLKNSNISGTGTSQQQLTVPDFKKTSILIPANDVMEHFTSIVTPLFAQMAANRIESERLTELRDTLLPKLMSGEINVTNISI